MKKMQPFLFILLSLFPVLGFTQQKNVVLYPVQVDKSESQFADPYGSALLEGLQSRYKVYFGPVVDKFFQKDNKKINCKAEECSKKLIGQFNTSLVAEAAVQKIPKGQIITFKITDALTNEVIESKTVPCKDCDSFDVIEQIKLLGVGNKAVTKIESEVSPEPDLSASIDSTETTGYTKIGANGKALDDSASKWECVLDNKSGLMWENKKLTGLHNKDAKYSWQDAHYSFLVSVIQEKLCGYSNWRTPTKEELAGLLTCTVNCSWDGPYINKEYFSNTANDTYWSVTPDAVSSSYAWIVSFVNGNVSVSHKNYDNYVRLVRSGQ